MRIPQASAAHASARMAPGGVPAASGTIRLLKTSHSHRWKCGEIALDGLPRGSDPSRSPPPLSWEINKCVLWTDALQSVAHQLHWGLNLMGEKSLCPLPAPHMETPWPSLFQPKCPRRLFFPQKNLRGPLLLKGTGTASHIWEGVQPFPSICCLDFGFFCPHGASLRQLVKRSAQVSRL